jgi:hypothetical protein
MKEEVGQRWFDGVAVMENKFALAKHSKDCTLLDEVLTDEELDQKEAREERANWLTSRQHHISIAAFVFAAVVGLGFAIASMIFKV